MKAIVTGGAGFIGSHLVNELVKKKYKVVVLDNLSSGTLKNLKSVKDKIKFFKCDLSKNKNLGKYFNKADYIFHLAGLVQNSPNKTNLKKYYQANVLGTLNVLNAARNTKIKKFIYAASASCYGNPNEIPTSEKAEINPLSPYAKTKWISERIVMDWFKNYKFPTVSLRFFNVYGSRARIDGPYSGVIGIFIKQKKNKKPFTIVGNGKQTRSFVHVSDVVKAILKAGKCKAKGEIFNVGSQTSIEINKIAKILGGKKINLPQRKGETKYSSANIKKIKKVLNWKPTVSIKSGLIALMQERET